jgi:hypothetical protein
MKRNAIVTNIERVNKIEQVKYKVTIPKNVSDINQYIQGLFEEGNFYEKAKVISVTILHGDISDQETIEITENNSVSS